MGNIPDTDERWRELFERSADAILTIENEKFVECNQATVEMLRYKTREQVLQTHPSEISPILQPDGRRSFEKANEMMSIALATGTHRFEWEHLRSDGSPFPVEVLLTSVGTSDSPIIHVVWRDLTKRKQLEEQLRRAQKMKAIGKFAGGIAHDFNNLLVVIMGHSSFLMEQLQSQSNLTLDSAQEIQQASEKAASLVRQLMSFCRQQKPETSTFDLDVALRNILKMLRFIIGNTISVHLASETKCSVQMDASQFDQIVMNLVSNASDAMKEGGDLFVEIELANEPLPDMEHDKEYWRLSVRDTGEGMSADVSKHAFEPFFTTKPEGSGTGFGLSNVYDIASQNGGFARIDSVPNMGTTVEVFLPRNIPISTSEDNFLSKQASRNGRLLIVEDEEQVASMIVQGLRREGYDVDFAENGQAALEQVEQSKSFDLIVTDVMMPKLTGSALVRKLKERDNCPPVLFIAGNPDKELYEFEEGNIEILIKPFSIRQLSDRIHTILQPPKPSLL